MGTKTIPVCDTCGAETDPPDLGPHASPGAPLTCATCKERAAALAALATAREAHAATVRADIKAAYDAALADAMAAWDAAHDPGAWTIPELEASLATGVHDPHLLALRIAEERGKARVGALTAIDARRASPATG